MYDSNVSGVLANAKATLQRLLRHAGAAPAQGARPAGAGEGGQAARHLPEALREMMRRLPGADMQGLDMPGLDLAGLSGLGKGRQPDVGPLPEGASFDRLTYVGAAGARDYRLYVPGGWQGQRLPLLVMLHGCTQTPEDFAAGTAMNALAEEFGFLVAYPAQSQGANAQRCWNWFRPEDQRHGQGEPALIAGITREVMVSHAVDPSRVYVAGLSAGGAFAAVMGATYPDLYAAVGVHSGLACGSARDVPSALAAMRQGEAGSRGGRSVPTIVFHGAEDATVSPRNGEHVVAQSGGDARLRLKVEHGRSAGGMAYSRMQHLNGEGRAVVEHWVVEGAGHAWSGGRPEGSYTEPRGPEASREMVRFFLRWKVVVAGLDR
jgi:poly(hydroxyalkanoate) depolymerase family esterase